MRSNVNEYEKLLEPWSFQIEYQDTTYETRRPTLGELVALEEASSRGGGFQNVLSTCDALRKTLGAIVLGEAKPPFDQWEESTLGRVARDLLSYFGERAKKNVEKLSPKEPSKS